MTRSVRSGPGTAGTLENGLHKIRIELDDLLVSSAASITRRAVEPIPFDPPIPPLSPSLLAAWNDAQRDVRRLQSERQAQRTGSTNASLNALTRQLIVEPIAVEPGERHRRLFSAGGEPGGIRDDRRPDSRYPDRTGIGHRPAASRGRTPDTDRHRTRSTPERRRGCRMTACATQMQRSKDDDATRFTVKPSDDRSLDYESSVLGQHSGRGTGLG